MEKITCRVRNSHYHLFLSPVIPDQFPQLGCRTSKYKVCLDGKDNYGFAIFSFVLRTLMNYQEIGHLGDEVWLQGPQLYVVI